MTHYEIITGQGSTTYSVSVGARGPAGPAASLDIDLASPDPIGSVTPNTGAFTTLSATGTATLPHIHGSLAGDIYIHVKNTSGVPLTRGTPVYIIGNVGDTDRVEVAAADNTDPAKMPAVGLLDQDLANNADGDAVILGELPAANTNAYTLNQELFVGVGALTGTKPTTGEVQSVGVVSRVQTNSGVIVVNMQGRRKTDVTAPTANTIALRNTNGGISAKHIRLHGDTYYAQINPPASGHTQDISFTLPNASGALATTSNVVTLTGNQTIAGAKTFSGQMELTGQTLISGSSAVTTSIADARYVSLFDNQTIDGNKTFYGQVVMPLQSPSEDGSVITKYIGDNRYSTLPYIGINEDIVSSTNNTPITLTYVTLPTGRYQIESLISATSLTSAGGFTFGLRANNNIKVTLVESYGADGLTTNSNSIGNDSITFMQRSIATGTSARRLITGIIDVITSQTTVSIEFCQNTTNAVASTTRKRAYIIATKIS